MYVDQSDWCIFVENKFVGKRPLVYKLREFFFTNFTSEKGDFVVAL